jgi:undecaprenyl-diphosphatase
MELWFAALLGLVQGLTEFLPISSTAHLKITTALLGQTDTAGAAFTAVIQLGSLAAVIVYFARDLFVDLPRAMFRDPTSPMGRVPLLLVVGSIPVAITGILLKKQIEGPLRSLYVIAAAMVAIGALMWLVDRRDSGTRGMTDLGYTDALLIGIAQSCAVVPGVSRSGSTICMCLALGMARPEAARFSFLLGIPALAGAGFFEMRGLGPIPWTPVLLASGIAFVTSYASIAWLIRWLGTHHLAPFAIYRILAGIAIASLALAGVVAP